MDILLVSRLLNVALHKLLLGFLVNLDDGFEVAHIRHGRLCHQLWGYFDHFFFDVSL